MLPPVPDNWPAALFGTATTSSLAILVWQVRDLTRRVNALEQREFARLMQTTPPNPAAPPARPRQGR